MRRYEAPGITNPFVHSRKPQIASRRDSAKIDVVPVSRDDDGYVIVNTDGSFEDLNTAITKFAGFQFTDLLCLDFPRNRRHLGANIEPRRRCHE